MLELRLALGDKHSRLRGKIGPCFLGLVSPSKRRCLGQITTLPRSSSPCTGFRSVKLSSLGVGCLQRHELFITGEIQAQAACPLIKDSALGGRLDWTAFQDFNCNSAGQKLLPRKYVGECVQCTSVQGETETAARVARWLQLWGKMRRGAHRGKGTCLSSLQL